MRMRNNLSNHSYHLCFIMFFLHMHVLLCFFLLNAIQNFVPKMPPKMFETSSNSSSYLLNNNQSKKPEILKVQSVLFV